MLRLILKCIISTLFLISCSSSEICPSPENLTPCTCYKSAEHLRVKCLNVRSLESLQRSMESLHGTKLHSLIIQNSVFDYLPSNIFENMTISHIILFKSNFSRVGNLGDEQFHGLDNSLEFLKFENTFTEMHPLPFLFLSHLKKLHYFEVRGSHCGIVYNLWFEDGPKSLREVKFINADILSVQYKAFGALENLRLLDLSDNKINFLTRSMLPDPALHFEELILERNLLETISASFFEGMPKLQRVNLELNNFSTLDGKVWGPIWNRLQYLTVIDNPIVCDRKLLWLLQKPMEQRQKLLGTCYKPFKWMDTEIYSLDADKVS